MGAETAALLTSSLWRGNDVPRGAGPVLLVPGFLAGDGSLALMAMWLRRIGYAPYTAGIVSNIACSERTVARLEERVLELSERHGEPVSIVGHSRGGTLARVVAVRHPDAVARVITLGSPHVATMADFHPLLRAQIRALQQLQRRSARGLIASACETSYRAYHDGLEPDGCCSQFWSDLDDDFPPGVGFTSIYSRSDGVLHWRCCLDPAARLVEVNSSHCGMSVNANVYREIAAALDAQAAPVVAQATDDVALAAG